MATEIKVLRPEDLEAVVEFEKKALVHTIEDEMERELFSWKAKWRRESLEHYLPLGWSFGLWETDANGEYIELLGYYLAQPQLFVNGLTQSLWVEHLSFKNKTIAQQLVDLAYRSARDKHLQKVVFAEGRKFEFAFVGLKSRMTQDQSLEILTAKIRET